MFRALLLALAVSRRGDGSRSCGQLREHLQVTRSGGVLRMVERKVADFGGHVKRVQQSRETQTVLPRTS